MCATYQSITAPTFELNEFDIGWGEFWKLELVFFYV